MTRLCLAVANDGIDFPTRCSLAQGHESPHAGFTYYGIQNEAVRWEDEND